MIDSTLGSRLWTLQHSFVWEGRGAQLGDLGVGLSSFCCIFHPCGEVCV